MLGACNTRNVPTCSLMSRAALLALALQLALLAAYTSPTGGSNTKEKFLLPIVRGFANNEVTGLKETLALGRLLDRTVILTGIIESSYEQLHGAAPRVIPFDHIFDPAAAKAKQAVTFLGTPDGWNGKVDLVAHFFGKGSDELWLRRWQEAFHLPMDTAVHKNYIAPHPFRCTADNLTTLRADFEEYDVVGVFSYLGVVHRAPGHQWGNDTPDGRNTARRPLTACQTAYMEATKTLIKAPQIRDLASTYIDKTFGADTFMALHVRPFPDSCLKVWQAKVFDEAKANRTQICDRPGGRPLHQVLGSAVSKAMEVMQLRRLFVMSHPGIRHHIDRLLGEYSITAHYIGLDAMHPEGSSATGSQGSSSRRTARGEGVADPGLQGRPRRALSAKGHTAHGAQASPEPYGVVSLLGMVEEEVAVRSKVFVATNGESSMAGMVMQERHAHGMSSDSSLAFEQLGRLPPDSWPAPWSG